MSFVSNCQHLCNHAISGLYSLVISTVEKLFTESLECLSCMHTQILAISVSYFCMFF